MKLFARGRVLPRVVTCGQTRKELGAAKPQKSKKTPRSLLSINTSVEVTVEYYNFNITIPRTFYNPSTIFKIIDICGRTVSLN